VHDLQVGDDTVADVGHHEDEEELQKGVKPSTSSACFWCKCKSQFPNVVFFTL
jgi:hypothetical protein